MVNPSESSDDVPDFSFLGDEGTAGGDDVGRVPDDAPDAFDFSGTSASDSVDDSTGSGGLNGPDATMSTASKPNEETVASEQVRDSAGAAGTSRPTQSGTADESVSKKPARRKRALPEKTQVASSASLMPRAQPRQQTGPGAVKPGETADRNADPDTELAGDMVSKKSFSIVVGYAVAMTLLFLALLAMGRISLFGAHPLESLPDIRPLQSNEFQRVQIDAAVGLPGSHQLKLGESQRFGDVILTAERVTREPVRFVHMSTGAEEPDMATGPVLKLWLRMENASSSVAFPPYELGLMCSRSPGEGTDDNTSANSWLMATQSDSGSSQRILNLLHSSESSFDLVGQNSRKVLQPGESMETFVACDRRIAEVKEDSVSSFRWRIQIRKGVHQPSGHGVTTLVDVSFRPGDIRS